MGRCLQEGKRQRRELPIDRIGAGIKQIQAKTVTFGATDMPLTVAQLEKDGLSQWPMVMGAIVPVVNVEGVKAGDMTLDGDTLAEIYLGPITRWDEPVIEARSEAEPSLGRRSPSFRPLDGSGTTLNFSGYCSGRRRLEVQDEPKVPQ